MNTATLNTEIAGLDRVLGGGLRLPAHEESGRPMGAVLIRGQPGTGKTLLALTLASRAASSAKKTACALYGSVEQTPDEVALFARQFGSALPASFWTAREFVEQPDARPPACVLNAFDPGALLTARAGGSAAESLRAQLDQWRGALAKRRCETAAVVLDGLMQGVPAVGAMDRAAFQDLARYGLDHGLLMILVEEAGAAMEWLPFACDAVIQLAHAPGNATLEVPLRRLTVVKSRFSAPVEGEHLYEISGEAGLAVYPAMHAYSARSVAKPEPVEESREFFGWVFVDQLGDELGPATDPEYIERVRNETGEAPKQQFHRKPLIPRGSVILIRGDDWSLVHDASSRFLAALPEPKTGLAIDLVLNPRSIRLYLARGEDVRLIDELGNAGFNRIDDALVLGDQATPPEKLLASLLGAIELWTARTGRQIARARIGNVRALDGFRKGSLERMCQFIQIAARSLREAGASVILAVAPNVPDTLSFHENITIQVSRENVQVELNEVTPLGQSRKLGRSRPKG